MACCSTTLFEFTQPGIGFFSGDVQTAISAVVFSSLEGGLPQGFALRLALHILLNGLAHEPVRRALAGIGQALDAAACVFRTLDARVP